MTSQTSMLDKQRDTLTFLEQYNCKGTIYIKIFSELSLITVEYFHKILHSQPSHIKTFLKIKKFIQDNINCSTSEICHQICEYKINGYESVPIQQIYY